ncbi:phosphatidylserine decarboxylase [Alkalilimnicola ehrlichii]|uniref:Phosphatidylserine decarboxylase proenzyme n=1 Tax=Alkalilimnicola ehrlichii TaxID=351052 RepID=A0A3E0X0A5_9GAMM|nr:archaetidylserine decarboxylase [Alkalilimnicola ehrlichii]RFA30905.1 phosphatidylserine decarboxylase [Alkalilimnicola ehrlichii]RFA38854.1 phosphatidylserine decarboxylase [Alkalilimnicola ehrlichii]
MSTSKSRETASFSDWAKSLPLYPLPHHAISRLTLAVTRCRWSWLKNALINAFVRAFKVDMSEAAAPEATAYEHFNAFFTRELKPGARPLPDSPTAIISPADGAISAIGPIEHDQLLQAKGHTYSVADLLGGDTELAQRFHGGRFVTVYLSPRDYHRIHMPCAGKLQRMIHVPGRLFSVGAHTVRTVPRLFARNERVVNLFEGEHGPMAIVLVGAINVGSIETVWSGVVTPPAGKRVRSWEYDQQNATQLARGDELGRFNMGSTAIVLFGPGQMEWDNTLENEQKVRMGQALGELTVEQKQSA